MKRVFPAIVLISFCPVAWSADVNVYVTDCTARQIVGEEIVLGKEKTNAVSLFASLGEYEPFSFALQPKGRIVDVMIRAGDLTGPAGTIPAENVVVQSVEGGHGANRMLCNLGRAWSMPAWSKELFWVTIHVPEDAEPGIYRGDVTIASADDPIAKVNVKLEVLPIKLDEPPFCIGWHYAWPGSVDSLRANLRDMREHGMTNVDPLYGFHMPINDDDTSQLAAFVDEYLRAGYTKPIMFAAPMGLSLSGLTGYGPVDSKRFQQKYIEVMRKLHAETRKHDVPVIFSIGDEFTNKGVRGVEYAGKLAKFVYEELPEICTTSDMNGHMEVMAMAPYLNYATFNNGWDGIDGHNEGRRLLNEKFIKELVEETGTIPYFVNAGKGRFPFGFFFWKMSKCGVVGKVEWFYNLGGTGGGRGSVVKLDGVKITHTVDYELSREGVDDLKYLCELEKLIAQAKRIGKARVETEAAEGFLKKLEDSIIPNWTAYSRGGTKWLPDGMEDVDLEKAATIGSLNTIRRVIADKILAIQNAMEQSPSGRTGADRAKRTRPNKPNVYFYWDCENQADGSILPNPPFWFGWKFVGSSTGPDIIDHPELCAQVKRGPAPQGEKYLQWKITDEDNHSRYTEVKGRGFPTRCTLGKTYYLAYYFNFTRIDGRDIWHERGQSADKGVELKGSGIRWCVSRGHWGGGYTRNEDHRYTVWLGNPTYHLNGDLEHTDAYYPNKSGYSAENPIQLDYERWYSCVMAVKMAADKTGSVAVWIDGMKLCEYENIKTCANTNPSITQITMGGTIAQPAYDAPAHYRKFDALLLTDNWQNIIDIGYLKKDSGSVRD